MAKPQPAQDNRWLALVATLPTEEPAIRMRALRTLESLGSAVMRDGVFLLPDTAANRQALEHLAEYIGKNGGTAQAMEVSPVGRQPAELRGLFDRSARYEELVKTVESLKVGFGIADPGAISRVLHKQRREFDAISALDFFPSEPRDRAQKALRDAEAAVHKLVFPAQGGQAARPGERMLRRIWATRRPLWADRLACAWLIRRFADPEATLIWLDKTEPCPDAAIGYAFEGARFRNSASRVTFEEMLAQLDLARNPALVKIGAIVHFLEVRGTPVPEAAGVQTLLQGALRRSSNDEELLLEAEKTFDLLYEAYCETPARK